MSTLEIYVIKQASSKLYVAELSSHASPKPGTMNPFSFTMESTNHRKRSLYKEEVRKKIIVRFLKGAT